MATKRAVSCKKEEESDSNGGDYNSSPPIYQHTIRRGLLWPKNPPKSREIPVPESSDSELSEAKEIEQSPSPPAVPIADLYGRRQSMRVGIARSMKPEESVPKYVDESTPEPEFATTPPKRRTKEAKAANAKILRDWYDGKLDLSSPNQMSLLTGALEFEFGESPPPELLRSITSVARPLYSTEADWKRRKAQQAKGYTPTVLKWVSGKYVDMENPVVMAEILEAVKVGFDVDRPEIDGKLLKSITKVAGGRQPMETPYFKDVIALTKAMVEKDREALEHKQRLANKIMANAAFDFIEVTNAAHNSENFPDPYEDSTHTTCTCDECSKKEAKELWFSDWGQALLRGEFDDDR